LSFQTRTQRLYKSIQMFNVYDNLLINALAKMTIDPLGQKMT